MRHLPYETSLSVLRGPDMLHHHGQPSIRWLPESMKMHDGSLVRLVAIIDAEGDLIALVPDREGGAVDSRMPEQIAQILTEYEDLPPQPCKGDHSPTWCGATDCQWIGA